jgi:ribosomal protein S14
MAKIQHKCNSKKRNDSQCRNNNWCPECGKENALEFEAEFTD